MTEQEQVDLTLGERRYLERVREAQTEGVSLRDYYLAHGLSLRMLSRVQRQLAHKGIVTSPSGAPAQAGGAGKLIEIQMAESVGRGAVPLAGAVCRLRHPSGWVIECGLWPDPQWMVQLMAGAQP